jgi:rhodanese-related sulfurtransferase
LLVGLVALMGNGSPCTAQEPYQVITTPQLKQWLTSNQKPLLVYSLSLVEFYEQRIPGSVCIPAEEMQNSRTLPPNLDQPMVFYCLGPG